MKELAGLLRDGNMKEFYKIANKVLMIRASNPVVRSIKTGIEGEEEVTEDRVLVEEAIANYFKDIYKKPDYMQNIVNEDEEMRKKWRLTPLQNFSNYRTSAKPLNVLILIKGSAPTALTGTSSNLMNYYAVRSPWK